MPVESKSLKEMFLAALAVAPAERAAWLERECGQDSDLRQRIELMLAAHDTPQSLLDRMAPASEPPEAATAAFPGRGAEHPLRSHQEVAGAVIAGRYKLVEEIGEGGMGTVWMAQQTEPVKRLVAVKLIKLGMDSKQVLARFEAERQALALMDHPNIARVLDAGTTKGEPGGVSPGRPFFVMELVKGVPLARYCDEHRLTPRQRLELFIPVCQAIQHAHQKGIIHRDIKPTNVLVCLYDGKPVPKVIDFGIAKATGQQLTERTLVTGFGNVVGTLEYMSPEQAELNQLDIDTRSDIYSLGVLLYELLTGSTPLEKKRLKQAAMLEVLRLIREEEPPRPSTRLSTTDEMPSVAANRSLEPKKLSGVVRGELDWIVMKALEKDRNRRYETANGFAQDIQRYLADEPVLACPPSAWYRFGKFARRNKVAVLLTAAALAFIAVAGAGIWSWQRQETLRRAERDFHAELTRRGVESSLKQLKDLHRRALWQQAEELLSQAEQQVGPEGDPALRDKLAQARRYTAVIKRLDEIRLNTSVIVEGKMDVAGALADYPKAFVESGFDVLGGDTAELAARLNASEVRDYLLAALDDWAMLADANDQQRIMAIAAAATGQGWRSQLRFAIYGAGLAELYDAIPEKERTPAMIREVARRLHGLGEDGIRRLEQGLRQFPGDFWLHFELGFLQATDRPDAAIGAYRAALALRPGTPAVLFNLGIVLGGKKEYDAAIAEYKEASRLDPKFAPPHHGLGNVLYEKKEYDAAIAEYKEAIRLDPKFAPPHHGLGNVLYDKKEYDAAIAEYKEAIRLDPKSAAPHHGLGSVLVGKKEYDAAIAEFNEAIRLDPKLALSHNALGNFLYDKKEYDAAIAEYKEAIRLDPKFSQPHHGLGNVLYDKKEYDAAIAEYNEAIRLDPKSAAPHHGLGNVLYDKKEYDAAIAEYKEAIRLDPKLALPHIGLGNVLYDKKEYDAAIAAYRDAITLKLDFAGAHYNLASSHYKIGNALRAQGRLDEALVAYRNAVTFKPDFAEAHCNLGHTLNEKGEFRQALEEIRRGHELGSRDPHGSYPSAQWVRQCERLVELDGKLPGFLDGKTAPASPAERIELAQLCSYKRLTRAAARFYEEAFAEQPKLADHLDSHRYNAACAAVLTGCGQGKDVDKLDDKECTSLRHQALDWLRAELEMQRALLAKDADKAYAGVFQSMRHWQADPDFAAVRGREALDRLPEAERLQWQKLWQEVAALRIAAGKDHPEYARETANWLLKDETAPGTLIKLPWQEVDFRIRYPERRGKIPANPILYMTFDEDTVQVKGKKLFVADLSGNGNHGVGEGVKYSSAGKLGGCLELSGGKLRLPKSLLNRRPEYTFTAWMYQDDDGRGPVYAELDSIVYEFKSDMFVNAWNGSRKPDAWKGGQPPGLSLPRGHWYFAAARLRNGGIDRGTVDIFVNGKRYEIPGQMMDTPDSSIFGVLRGFGRIDEVAVYDRALSDDEIEVLHRLPAPDPTRAPSPSAEK